jgi:hypothetical protein
MTTGRRPLFDALASSIIAALVSGAFALLGAYLTAPSGYVVVGGRISMPGASAPSAIPVDIGNYNQSGDIELLLEVPRAVDPSTITSSRPVRVVVDSGTVGASESILLRVSRVAPASVTRLLIPVDTTNGVFSVLPRQTEGTKLDFQTDSSIKFPMAGALGRALATMVVNFVMFFLLSFLSSRYYLPKLEAMTVEAEALSQRVERLVTQQEKLDIQHESQKKEDQVRMKKLESRTLRIRVLLVSRISDLRRELDFWRDTLRSYVVQTGKPVADADLLIRQVSKQLKTFSTLSDYPDPDLVRISAAMLREGDALLSRDRSLFDPAEK